MIALLATMLTGSALLLILSPSPRPPRSSGLRVTIAIAGPCAEAGAAGEPVRMLGPGRVWLRSREMTLAEFDHSLAQALWDKVQRIVLLSGGAGLLFHDAASVIGTAARHADYVALVTPAVEQEVARTSGACVDANVRIRQILM